MEIIKFRAINHKGKREYVYDPKGIYILSNNKFVKQGKPPIDPKQIELENQFKELISGNQHLKRRVKGIRDILKKIYYVKVWMITESNDLTTLKNHEKRSFRGHHLDHIYSISMGFKNNIPPELIGNIKNLRFITRKKNMKKGATIDEEGIRIIEQLINNQ